MREISSRNILDALPDGILLADALGHILWSNRAARDLLGENPSPLPEWGSRLGWTPADDAPGTPVGSLDADSIVRGLPLSIWRVPQTPAGTQGPWYCEIEVLPCECPEIPAGRALIRVRDVTDLHLQRSALERDRCFFESIIENVPAMIFVKEARHLKFVRFNRAGEELLGLSRQDLIGRDDYDFFPKDQADFFTRRDRETLRSATPVDIPEEPIQTAQGVRWLHTRKVPIRDSRGEPAFLLGISVDITEQKMAKEALEKAREELENRVQQRTADLARANMELRREIEERLRTEEALRASEARLLQSQKMEAVGRLAGGVAHDFNNMLTVILSYAQMLQESQGPGDPPLRGLSEIIAAAERAASLTRQLLAFSRLQVMQPIPVDLGQVLSQLRGMLERLIGEDIRLETSIPPNLPLVMADPSQIEQVILNLSVNARDAMPTGGTLSISIDSRTLKEPLPTPQQVLPPGRFVVIEVRDTGLGMDKATQQRLFEPFFTTKSVGKGTGLGLSTCYGIVRQSGGDILFESTPGRGSTFRVFLPVLEEGTQARTKSPKVMPVRSARNGDPGHETVLLVEDEDLVRSASREILQSAGFQVLVARDPSEALALSRSHEGIIDLLVTDVVMPQMNGRELARLMQEERPGIRVLFVSGYTENIIAHHGVLEPDLTFLPKPFTPEALLETVREVLTWEPDKTPSGPIRQASKNQN